MGQRELEAAVSNLVGGFKKGESGIVLEGNLFRLGTLLAAATKDLNGNINAALTRARGAVMNRAEDFFYEDIKRPAESGEGQGGRRQTGRFTFGDGATFESREVSISEDNRGFGFPDISRADTRTNGVWRALEFGLPGTRHSAESIRFSGLTQFHVTRPHRLPERYEFTTFNASTAVLRLNTPRKRDVRFGAGFEGKHFIERAWIHTLDVFQRDYQRIGVNAFKAWRG